MPIISIITVNKNNASLLNVTLKKHLKFSKNFVELIVIDGNSSDSSFSLLKKYRKEIDISISEPDNGIYSAMNKGVKYASGEYVVFINSGDFILTSNILNIIIEYLSNYSPDILYTDYVRQYNNKKILISSSKSFETEMPTSHQCIFYKKSLFNKKIYNEKYKLCADLEHYMYLLSKNITISYLPIATVSMDMSGVSTKNIFLYLREYFLIIKKYRNLTYAIFKVTIRFFRRAFARLFPTYLIRFYLNKFI